MNIFWHELKSYRKSTLTWTLSLSALVIVFLNMYPAFSSDIESAKKFLGSLPAAMRAAFEIDINTFFSILGFYIYLFTFVILNGSIQAANLGLGIISKEITGKTADFLLTKPISRTSIITQKMLAALTSLVITDVVFIAVAATTATIIAGKDLNLKNFMLISLVLLLVQLMFLAIGFLLSVMIPKIKSVISFSLPIVFGYFIVGMLDAIFGIEKIRYLTPFKFYDVSYIAKHGAFETKFLIIEAVFLIIVIASTYITYLRKDMPSTT